MHDGGGEPGSPEEGAGEPGGDCEEPVRETQVGQAGMDDGDGEVVSRGFVERRLEDVVESLGWVTVGWKEGVDGGVVGWFCRR